MQNISSQLPHPNVLKQIGQCADALNLPCYAVGGYVRDIFLNRPSNDIDVVCVGSGIALAQAYAATLPGKVPVAVFKNFGTAAISYKGLEIEFVGARKESYQRNSRKPIVEDGTLEDDQNRRDFTINAMAVSLNNATFGQVIDPFGGLLHLEKKIIKTPLEPEVTFSDDPLRMMRAVRFAAQLNFDIEPDTFAALLEQKERLKIISTERIITELNKIIQVPKPSYGFKLLYHSGLLAEFFPELVALAGVETLDGKGHKDNFYHTLQVLDNVCELSDDLWLRWAAILHDIAKPATKRFNKQAGWTFHGHEDKGARMTPKIFKRLKLPMGAPMKKVQKLVRLHLRPIALVDQNVTDSAVRRLLYEAGEDVEDLMMLCRSDITSKNPNKVQKYLNNFDRVEQKMKDVEESDKIRNFQPVITGEVIMETFGIEPSQLVGTLKTAIREAILEGEIKNQYPEAFDLLIQLGKKHNLTPKK